MKNEMKNGAANAQVNAGNASVNANARTLHSAYDKDLLALFDKTAEHELDVHTTLVDVRRMCPKGTALRKLFDEKWGDIFKTALTYMPCAICEDGHPYVVTLKRMDENGKMVAVYRTENKKRVFVPFDKYGFSSVVRKALRAAVDAVAGVVESAPKKSAK